MGRRAVARTGGGKARAGAQGVGLLALRAFAVCGLFAGTAVGAILSMHDSGSETSAPPAHLVSIFPQVPQVPRTVALQPKHPAPQMLDEDFSDAEAAETWSHRIPEADLGQNLATDHDGYQVVKFGPVKIRRQLVDTIVQAARETGADPALLMAIADKESSFSTDVKAQTSSATGLFQFIDTTWFRVVREFGAEHGLAKEAAAVQGPDDKLVVADPQQRAHILSLRNDPYLSALFAAEMLQHDGGEIARSIGRDLTEGETYLTHFLGPQDASLFMETMVDQPKLNAAKLLPRPASANRPIFFGHGRRSALSVEAVHDKFEEMMGARIDRYSKVDEVTASNASASSD